MNKTILVVGLIALVVVIGGIYLASDKVETTGNVVSEGNGNLGTGATKTFAVTGDHFRFFIDGIENPDIVVKEGDRVRIEYTGVEGFHDWKIDEFNAFTEQVPAEQTSSVEFVADKKGTYEYYCSVGQHRANGMKGKFIVE